MRRTNGNKIKWTNVHICSTSNKTDFGFSHSSTIPHSQQTPQQRHTPIGLTDSKQFFFLSRSILPLSSFLFLSNSFIFIVYLWRISFSSFYKPKAAWMHFSFQFSGERKILWILIASLSSIVYNFNWSNKLRIITITSTMMPSMRSFVKKRSYAIDMCYLFNRLNLLDSSLSLSLALLFASTHYAYRNRSPIESTKPKTHTALHLFIFYSTDLVSI